MCVGLSAIVVRSEYGHRAWSSGTTWRGAFLLWIDGVEEGWGIPLLIAGLVALSMAYFAVAYIQGDLHQDVIETWSLGRSFEWGSSKHPPLMAWAARAWTTVFPLTNWSFNLLAMTNSAIGLWFTDRIARQFVRGDKRLTVLLLLLVLPIYQLHAQRFNANAVLLSTWPLATFCFLRSFQTRRTSWAIAAGATAALAMLGKYYSIFLIGSFAVAALCHGQRKDYFSSRAPWIAAATGLAVLTPHIYWLATTGAQPFSYALEHHSGKAPVAALVEAIGFVLAMSGLIAIPGLIWLSMARPRPSRLLDDIFGLDARLRLLLSIGIGTVAFPALTSAIFGTDMPPLWGLQGIFLFVIVIVCGATYRVPRERTVNLAATVVAIGALATLVVAPLHAVYRNSFPLHEGRNFYQPAVAELTRQWHATSDTALPAVGGDEGLAFAAAFYSPDHPVFQTELVHPNELKLPDGAGFSEGWAALCYDNDVSCISGMDAAAARTKHAIRSTFSLTTSLFGWEGASQGFVALIVPPATDEAPQPEASHGIAEDLSSQRRSRPMLN
ncbi:conserved membrane hypothetical protein [Bradyrhizobium sp. STM 3843]|uniref:glycosyltransferase family 39 protein n=1 Tax=Bradyrhizobium sp. STM 3843 TaxID=551947 RepID=UPI0002403044|nr:glycosyltransferase family 39 protein [Bradyrhizobium sp. STM 3843]CCE08220.1 conserved membrane hypothetical protein [Bradyrhizobium sp. STM 3843]